MSVGEKIKQLRKRENMTQKELAQRTGFAEITIRQYENHNRTPKLETLIKIADALNVPVYELLDDFRAELSEIPRKFEATFKQSLQMTRESINEALPKFAENAQDVLNSDFRSAFLLNDFGRLNNAGRNVALERIKELTEIERYIAPDDPAPADQPDQHPDQD